MKNPNTAFFDTIRSLAVAPNPAPDYPLIEDILDGKVTHYAPTLGEARILSTALIYELKDRQDTIRRRDNDAKERAVWLKQFDTALAFMLTNLPPEVTLLAIKQATTVHNIKVETDRLKHWEAIDRLYASSDVQKLSALLEGKAPGSFDSKKVLSGEQVGLDDDYTYSAIEQQSMVGSMASSLRAEVARVRGERLFIRLPDPAMDGQLYSDPVALVRDDEPEAGAYAAWLESGEYDEWLARADRFLGFVINHLEPKFALYAAHLSIVTFDLPLDPERLSNFSPFAGRVRSLMGRDTDPTLNPYSRSGLPPTDLILNGYLTRLDGEHSDYQIMILLLRLVLALKASAETVRQVGPNWMSSTERTEWLKQADRFIGFMLDNMEEKHCMLGLKLAISEVKLPLDTQKMKNFERFFVRFRDAVMGGRYL